MELNTEVVTTPPRPAATVVLLRDGAQGLEAFLLRRHGASDVLGGVYVFPGGKLDAADSGPALAARLDQEPEALHAALGEPDTDAGMAAGLFVAALREAFEECGVLFAESAAGHAVDTARAAALLREGLSFGELLAGLALRLQTRALLPWSRWITPRQPSITNKRFDTRFFVAALPPGQTAQHDDHETTDSVWLAPRAALEQYRDGQIDMIAPQIMSLAHLARHASVASVLEAARLRPPPLIEPQPFEEDGMRVICYPGDPRHPVRERALPGPTRLCFRNKRFEPMQGFDELLG
ncbi:NUDIX hydrolase [Ramlibacter sp. 2FC]|uniref:NUDIX hydrolase n=1 Tax=Ramlibacter sp. 2FC TaxID=2502188 RepID=UPI0010F5EA27|nr:NUDIX hydrolase [Ramlibacter sp. 2FC]